MRRPVLVLVVAASALAIAGPPVASGAGHAPVVAKASKKKCDKNYRGRCLKPNVSDYDCAGGSGNGPYYVRGPFKVVGNDHYCLDADGGGIACER